MNKILVIICSLAFIGIALYFLPNAAGAVLTLIICSAIAITIIRHNSQDDGFLLKVFLIGLLLRIGFGLMLEIFDLRLFFGADATVYDTYGYKLYQSWFEGLSLRNDVVTLSLTGTASSGWGMYYLVAGIYSLLGRNILAAQFFCAVIGAGIAPMVYTCAHKIFGNRQVGKTAAFMVAVFPAFVLWSSQLMKDGLIIFLLVLSITMVLQLQEKFSYLAVALLMFSLLGILSLRFYIFFMVVVSVVGSFVVGSSSNNQSIFKRVVAILIIGVGLTYLGGVQTASENFEKFGSLERVNASRADLARSAESGYGENLDVSTTEGAISALPVGFAYLMFAPFPWQVGNLRQVIALPEVLLWWAMMPLLVFGLWYTIRNRLRNAIPVLLFTLLLTIGYSLFQGNVGTAYRQRTQIQVFLYIFIAVGWTLRKEKKENSKLESAISSRRIRQNLATNR
jgi:hypothetical protein